MKLVQIFLITIMSFIIAFFLIFLYGDNSDVNIPDRVKIKKVTKKSKQDKIEEKYSSLTLKNLISNGNLDGTKGYKGVEYHKYITSQNHSNDESGSIEIVGHWYTKALSSPKFKLQKGKYYTIGAYIKAIGADKGQNIVFKISGPGYFDEMNWNVSKAGVWENIIMPFRARETGYYKISIFTYKYSFTKDKNYAKKDGSNLDRSAKIYIDDFYVYEGEGITKEPITIKTPFKSPIVKVDSLGNWSIKEDGKWKNIFPKFVYQDWSKSFAKSAKIYSSYGFTGFTNITSIKKINSAIKNGMKYNSIQINNLNPNNPKDKIIKLIKSVNRAISLAQLPKTAVINYEFDNEGKALCNFEQKRDIANAIDKADGGKRVRPINMLNGVSEGVARNYKNSSNKNYLDTVSTYMAEFEHNFKPDYNQSYNPVNTLGILQKAQNQIAPTSIMQLQCYYGKKMIPYIFKGIGAGAKGLNFWRAGRGVPKVCPTNFEKNYFAPVLKDIFAKIDKMLPIIREPLNTSWSAKVDKSTLVSIGTREHKNRHYIILANFADRDLKTKITLKKLKAKIVKDYFSKKVLAKVNSDNSFSIKIGHNNSGFLVIELK